MITKRFVIVSLLLVFIVCACTPSTSPEPLTKTAEEEEMIVLPSGLKYQVIKEGTGAKPGLRDTVTMDYHGTLVDGAVYHSSYERGKPVTIQVNRLIKGWSEALTLMQEGAEWKLFIPPELAYGERGSGQVIGPNEALILDVVLIKVQ
jgi:FKBP-type peptidyl-prolyl cis-trans isomerase FklB